MCRQAELAEGSLKTAHKGERRNNSLRKVESFSRKVKIVRAYGGCLGADRRRRTRQAAKCHGELQASVDPWISEWGNPAEENLCHPYLNA